MKRYLMIMPVLAMLLSCSRTEEVRVTAAFTTNKDVYQVGEDVVIMNESRVSGDILAFCRWAFGDGDNVSYRYSIDVDDLTFSAPGTYTIALTAYAEQGAGEDTCVKTIKVIDENDAPWAEFRCPATVKVGEDVLFEDCSVDHVGGIDSWTWNIGGVESHYQSPLIRFDTPALGVKVVLTVVDVYGASGTQTRLIDITE